MSINMHEAKTHFSRLVERASAGETVIISRAGKPVAKLTGIPAPEATKRVGFLIGEARIPADFNEWGRDEVASLFEASE
jgi:prevent-host-death family protein